MPKRTRARSLARKSSTAEATKRRRYQEDDQESNRRLALDRLSHSLARNAQPATANVRQKKGDYASIALEYDPETFQIETCLGEMRQVCACGASRFSGEPPSICCANGQVSLQQFPPPPEYLRQLYDGHHPHSKHFLDNIRKYNCVFQMTSEFNLLAKVAYAIQLLGYI